ncbi:MAG: 3-isopropylmalate dehydratase [Candidatus Omnitrophica bacterium]|nr:3-isopropylmalate dehydratase [Candidatus Omnitrophota bacterium]
MIIKGEVIRLTQDDDVNTDYIISGRYKFQIQDPKELAKYVFNDLEPDFIKRLAGRGIIAAGENFGCGSSREQAPLALKYAGIKVIVAKSFARIFYRNAFNLGIILIEADTEDIKDGDLIELDLDSGFLKNKSRELELKVNPLPDFMKEVVKLGSIVNYFNKYGGFKF